MLRTVTVLLTLAGLCAAASGLTPRPLTDGERAALRDSTPNISWKDRIGEDPPEEVRESHPLQLETTTIDYQSNGSVGKMIAVNANGIAHLTWMGGESAVLRRARTACVDVSSAEPAYLSPPADVFDSYAGFPRIAVVGEDPANGLPPNGSVIAAHAAAPPAIRFFVMEAGCPPPMGPFPEVPVGTDVLWPQVAVDWRGKIHVACGDASTGVFEDAVWYDTSSDGEAFDGGLALVTDNANTLSHVVAAAKDTPGAAVLFMQDAPAAPQVFFEGDYTATLWAHDLYAYEARDDDNDLHGVVEAGDPVNLTRYHDPESTTPFAFGCFAYADIDAVYDRLDDPHLHVAWSTPLAFADSMLYADPLHPEEGLQSTAFSHVDWGSALWHRDATTGATSRIGGRLVGPDEDWVAPNPGDYRLSQDRVQLGVDPATGYLYAAWSAFDDGDRRDDGELPNGEIFASCSADNGASWGAAVNLTNTATPGCAVGDCASENVVSLAETVHGGRLHLSYLLDVYPDQPHEQQPAINPWMYLGVDVEDVPPPVGPGETDNRIGFVDYRRPWWFSEGHPDTLEIHDKLHLVNDTGSEAWLVRVEAFLDPRDEFELGGDLQLGWEVFEGDPRDGGEYLSNPQWPGDWEGRLAPWSITLLRVCVRHLGLPAAEQAFRFTFSTGEQRVYRYVYDAASGEGSRVDVLDLDALDDMPHFELFGPIGEVEPRDGAPAAFDLGAAWPNPFNPSTTIPFELSAPGRVRLEVFDLRGAKVATLQDGPLAAGCHQRRFDGAGLASGLYLARLSSGTGHVETAKLLLVK